MTWGAALLALTLSVGAPVSEAEAGVSPGCRLPDVFVNLPGTLKRTERLVDTNRPVRIFALGPYLSEPDRAELRRNRLQSELEQRLPWMRFEFIDAPRVSRLAGDDFEAIRREVAKNEPDLVIWQVGAQDAIAATDLDDFEATLRQAAGWLAKRGIDLVLIDPPFVPGVAHEPIYGRIVRKIGEVSERVGLNLFRRYASSRHLALEQQRLASPPADADQRRVCMSELVAEAIVKAVTR